MLLRRVMEHVRDQNWTAIVIDFFIVVVGVFIGIQVANWNETLKGQREESMLVARLAVDFDRIQHDAQQSLAFHQQMLSDLKTLARSLRSGTLAEPDIPAINRALLLGLSIQTSADRSGTFTELLSSGRANLLRDKDLLNELVAYEDFLERFDVAKEFQMGLLLNMQQPYMGGYSYELDKPFSDAALQLELSMLPAVVYDFEEMVSDDAFREATEQLIFVHNVALVWRSRISDRVTGIQRMLADASGRGAQSAPAVVSESDLAAAIQAPR